MIAELRELLADIDGCKFISLRERVISERLHKILDSQDSKYADVLKQMAEDERHLRELVDRLEKIVGMGRSIT